MRLVRAFLHKAYSDNLTGLSAMLGYNLMLSLLALALVAVFVFGRVLASHPLEGSVLSDLRNLFPTTTESALSATLDSVRHISTSVGLLAILASVWLAGSFWGALDTAFCRIYHVRCRSWLEQKLFALGMIVVVLLFMATTTLVPAVQSLLIAGVSSFSLSLGAVHGIVFWLTLVIGAVAEFGLLCVIYWAVPNRAVPWRAIWPGGVLATLAVSAIAYGFPVYLRNVSTVGKIRTQYVFILVLLIWFYAVAMSILGGAVVNAMRFELHDTGELRRASL